jgi:hypothetical protein
VAEAMDRVHHANRASAAAAAAAAASTGDTAAPRTVVTIGRREYRVSDSSSNASPTAAAAAADGSSGSGPVWRQQSGSPLPSGAATSTSSSRHGTRGGDGIPTVAAPAGIRVSLSSGALAGSSSGGGCSGSSSTRTGGGVPMMGPPPSPKRPLSTPPSVAGSDAGSDRDSVHSLPVQQAAANAGSSGSSSLLAGAGTGLVRGSSNMIDLSSPRSLSGSTTPAAAGTAAAAAGQPPGESIWDPFAPPSHISRSSSSILSAAQVSTAAAAGSSRGRESSSSSQSGIPTAAQQQQPKVQPGNKLTLQDLRQQLDELSFSQLSQQQGTRFVEQQGARLELLEQLSRQQQVLQKHYSLPKNYQVHIPLSSPKPPRPSQQQQGLGPGVYRQQSVGSMPLGGRGPAPPSQVRLLRVSRVVPNTK